MTQHKSLEHIDNLLLWIRRIQKTRVLHEMSIFDLQLLADQIIEHRSLHKLPYRVYEIAPEFKDNVNYQILVKLLTMYEMYCHAYIASKKEEFVKQVEAQPEKPEIKVTIGYSKLIGGKARFAKLNPSKKFFIERVKAGMTLNFHPFISVTKI